MMKRVVRFDDLIGCTAAFIDAKTPGSHLKENFIIIGAGVSENSAQHVHITEPHGFTFGGRDKPHASKTRHTATKPPKHSGSTPANGASTGA